MKNMNCLFSNLKIFPFSKKYSYKNVNVITEYSHIKYKLDAIVNSPNFKNWIVPSLIKYNGNWKAIFKRRERGIFTISFFDFE